MRLEETECNRGMFRFFTRFIPVICINRNFDAPFDGTRKVGFSVVLVSSKAIKLWWSCSGHWIVDCRPKMDLNEVSSADHLLGSLPPLTGFLEWLVFARRVSTGTFVVIVPCTIYYDYGE